LMLRVICKVQARSSPPLIIFLLSIPCFLPVSESMMIHESIESFSEPLTPEMYAVLLYPFFCLLVIHTFLRFNSKEKMARLERENEKLKMAGSSGDSELATKVVLLQNQLDDAGRLNEIYENKLKEMTLQLQTLKRYSLLNTGFINLPNTEFSLTVTRVCQELQRNNMRYSA
jgi:hypothetical protein